MKRIALATALAVAVFSAGGAALAMTLQYRAAPSGAFEVPAVDSSASANLKLKVSPHSADARYDLKIDEPIENVVMAHLHLAAAGTNGPIVVWLYPHDGPPPALIEGTFEGRLAKDVITVDDLEGPLTGNWDGFLEALNNGDLYVNVHTTAHPNGEIRDQVHNHGG
jgi:hypothetical protein